MLLDDCVDSRKVSCIGKLMPQDGPKIVVFSCVMVVELGPEFLPASQHGRRCGRAIAVPVQLSGGIAQPRQVTAQSRVHGQHEADVGGLCLAAAARPRPQPPHTHHPYGDSSQRPHQPASTFRSQQVPHLNSMALAEFGDFKCSTGLSRARPGTLELGGYTIATSARVSAAETPNARGRNVINPIALTTGCGRMFRAGWWLRSLTSVSSTALQT